jgi:Fe-S-cluster-containing dehydrogenase component
MNRRRFLASFACLCSLPALPKAEEQAEKDMRKSMIVRSKCVGCGDCVRNCPMTAIALDSGKASVDRELCVGCRTCLMTCSFGAPYI